jgi:hypothetical protein
MVGLAHGMARRWLQPPRARILSASHHTEIGSMASLLCPAVPYYRNPQYRPGLAALVEFLMRHDYITLDRWRIYDHVAVHGTLEGSAIEPSDMAQAEAVFVHALPAVEPDSEAWDRDTSLIMDVELLLRGEHPFPIPTVGDDDRAGPDDFDRATDALADLPLLLPISGGAPFEPGAADWDDYREWADRLDTLERPQEQDRREAMGRALPEPPVYGYE